MISTIPAQPLLDVPLCCLAGSSLLLVADKGTTPRVQMMSSLRTVTLLDLNFQSV